MNIQEKKNFLIDGIMASAIIFILMGLMSLLPQ